MWFVMLAVLVYFLYSLAAAAATAGDCDGGATEWRFFPPGYECQRSIGLG